MGRLIQEKDWSSTPMGPLASWPQSLKTAVQIMVGSRYPMFIWWGEELVQFYNDGYAPILGGRHPDSLGCRADEIWAEIWPVVGPQAETVRSKGEAVHFTELLLFMERHGYKEETYFTYSYSPIVDEGGEVRGIFCACTEDTKRVVNARRLRVLRELSDATANVRTSEAACRRSLKVLQRNGEDHPFALLYLLDERRQTARLAGTAGLEPGSAARPKELRLDDESAVWPLREACLSRRPIEVERLPSSLQLEPDGAWSEPVRRALALPLARSGTDRLIGVLVVGASPVARRDEEYDGYLELLSEQLASALSGAQSYEEEHERAETLAARNQARTTFFNNVSHEFRTPLTLLIAPLEETLRDLPPEAPHRLAVETAYRNSLHLLKLVNTLLDFSRIEAGSGQARFRLVDLRRLTMQVAGYFESLMQRAGLRFHVRCEELEEAVYVDPEMWEKIVLNLISNAFKFTFSGEIVIRLRAAASEEQSESAEADGWIEAKPSICAVLEVEDTGVGIPPEALDRIFQRFYRVEDSPGRSFEGTGIGLALAKELVELHGGRITVESHVGSGSTFRVKIPCGREHLPVAQTQLGPLATERRSSSFLADAQRWLQLESPAVRTSRPRKTAKTLGAGEGEAVVLLADDNPDMREYVAGLLSSRYQVVLAENGEDAMTAIAERRPDLILADVMMPRMDGLALLKSLRAEEATRMTPVILLSARAGEEACAEGLAAGADDYLVKPFSAGELLARISSRLEINRIRDDAMSNERMLRERAEQALQARLEAEKDILRLNRRLTAVLETASIGMHWANEAGEIIWANDSELQMLQYRKEEYVGRNLREFFVDTQIVDEIFEVLRRGERVIDRRVRLRAKDGSIRVALLDVSVLWEGETFVHAQCFSRDVTDREHALEALKQAEYRQRQLFQNMPIAIYTCDVEGMLTHYNAAAVELWGREPVAGADRWCGAARFYDAEGRALEPEEGPLAVALLSGGESGKSEELLIERPDGTTVPVLPYPELIYDTAGKIVGGVNMLVDISSRKRIERSLELARQQAEEANLTKSEFLANMSHEIRTPMTSILGYADLLQGNLSDPDDLESVNTIRRNGEYLIEIINDILDISRIEAGKIEIERLRFSPHQLVGDVYALMIGPASDKGLDFTVRFDGDLPATINSDPTRLRQILINLVSNAIKFTHEGGVEFRVALRQEEQELEFQIIDTGIGIDREQLDKLFQPFSQGDSSYARRYGGSGLGLAISLRLAGMLGGAISARSKVGSGSAFTLTVSTGSLEGVAIVPDDRSWRREPQQPRLPSKRIDCRVMIVDDRREVRQLAQYFVEESGARAISAHNGRAAIDRLQRERETGNTVDAVVLDMQMPELDGYQTARILRERGFELPIIAMTAHAMRGNEERCRAAGCDAYLTKPIDRRKLVETLDRLVAEHRLTAANRPAETAEAGRGSPKENVALKNVELKDVEKKKENAKPRLLLVEDNANLRKILKLSLSMRGFEVETAEDGGSALAAIQRFQPQALVVDIGLPDMSGHELLERTRSELEFAVTVRVALSGRDEAEDRERSAAAGFDAHFVKPPDLGEVVGYIQSKLAQSR